MSGNGCKPPGSRITLAMLVRDEAGRYLERVLAHAARYVDAAVIVDNASDDESVEVCRRTLAGLPLRMAVNPEHQFADESALRRQVWNLAAETGPDWLLLLDADEVFEDRAVTELPRLTATPNVDVYYFRLYDFWDSERYRDDTLWRAHRQYQPFLLRFRRDFAYEWANAPLHSGRTPINLKRLAGAASLLRLKHLGWVRPEDRAAKYRQYAMLDPAGRFNLAAQYRSILDPEPRLSAWIEDGFLNPLESRFLVRGDSPGARLTYGPPPDRWRADIIREWARSLAKPGESALFLGSDSADSCRLALAADCRQVCVCTEDERVASPLPAAIDLRRAAPPALPYPGESFDKIFFLTGLEGLDPAQAGRALCECRRVLKPEGLLALSFTFPPLDVAAFDRLCAAAGLDYAGEVSPLPTVDALMGPATGGNSAFCYRAVVRRLEAGI